jgi:hypothetical protein
MVIMMCSVATAPAQALGVADLAKTVLGGSSVLKKGEEKCGQSIGITKRDSLAITYARGVVEQTLPISQFVALDQLATTDAATAAQNDSFCKETVAKKPSMMKTIVKAGKAILKARALGNLGL